MRNIYTQEKITVHNLLPILISTGSFAHVCFRPVFASFFTMNLANAGPLRMVAFPVRGLFLPASTVLCDCPGAAAWVWTFSPSLLRPRNYDVIFGRLRVFCDFDWFVITLLLRGFGPRTSRRSNHVRTSYTLRLGAMYLSF